MERARQRKQIMRGQEGNDENQPNGRCLILSCINHIFEVVLQNLLIFLPAIILLLQHFPLPLLPRLSSTMMLVTSLYISSFITLPVISQL